MTMGGSTFVTSSHLDNHRKEEEMLKLNANNMLHFLEEM